MISIDFDAAFDYGAGTYHTGARLEQQADCSITVTAPAGLHIVPMSWDTCSVSGTAPNGLILEPQTGYPARSTMTLGGPQSGQTFTTKLFRSVLRSSGVPVGANDVKLRAHLTNVPYWDMGGAACRLQLSGFDVGIVPSPHGCITHALEASGCTFADVERFGQVAEALSHLCSFASGRHCRVARLEAHVAETPVLLDMRSVDTGFATGREVIKQLADEEDISSFVQHSLPLYEAIKATYPLDTLFHLLSAAKHTRYLDMCTLILANFLEVIRYNFALNVGVPAGTYSLDGDNFKHTVGPKANKTASFRDLLEAFCATYGISRWETRFKDMRNEITHTGNLGLPASQWLGSNGDLMHFCDCALLALLDWDRANGHYVPANVDPYPVEKQALPGGGETITFRFVREPFTR